jgi:hypothetical protein
MNATPSLVAVCLSVHSYVAWPSTHAACCSTTPRSV